VATLDDPELLRTVLETLPLGVYIVDRERRIRFWNEGAEMITGFLRQDVVGRFCRDDILVHCDEHNVNLCVAGCPLTKVLRDGQPSEADMYLQHRGGYRVPVRVRAVPLRDRNGSILGVAETFEERSKFPRPDRRRRKLEAAGCLDPSTGLASPRFVESQILQHLILLERHAIPFGILQVEVERLQHFQELRGREAVDEILRVVGQTLVNSLRHTDVVGLWGSDRFVIVVTFCQAAALTKVGQRLHWIVPRAAIPWWGDQLSVSISAGITAARAVDTVETILQRSERALEKSRNQGGNAVLLWD